MANLPFRLNVLRDTAARKREESPHASEQYERKLAEYREALENYKNCIMAYSGKLENYEKRNLDNQLSVVQTALDITYLKEQGERSIELLEEIKADQLSKTLANLEHLITAVLDTNYKLESLDKNAVNRISELMIELQKQTGSKNDEQHAELERDIDYLGDKVRKHTVLLWFLFVFQLIGLGGLAFVILYIMKVIPF
jgi:predicted  nucleic acid-binding Zn-ribbon protein